MTERIFDGLKVIDCASFIAGPAAATVMSDFGAEVDQDRAAGHGRPVSPPRRADPPGQPAINPGFVLRQPQQEEPGARPAHRGGARGAVPAGARAPTCSSPTTRRRCASGSSITYDDLAPLNERLIYASFTGYGETGPEASKPGFDATAWWARTGLMHLVRAGEEATPARSLPGMGDHPSAMGTYGAIVTALYQRERTGKGNYVGSSLLANGLWANGCSVQAALCGDQVRAAAAARGGGQRAARALPLPRRALAAAVDRLRRMALGQVQGVPRRRRRSTTRASPPSPSREEHARELVRDPRPASSRRATWPIGARVLDEAGLIFGIVAETQDIATDEQVLAAGHLVPLYRRRIHDRQQPVRDHAARKRCRRAGARGRRAQRAGAARSRLLPDAEIAALREAGVSRLTGMPGTPGLTPPSCPARQPCRTGGCRTVCGAPC